MQRTDTAYPADVFEDLIGRFESPDTKNRWDTPLFRINPLSEALDELLQAPIVAVTGKGC